MATQSANTATLSATTATAQSASAISVRPPRTITQRWLFAAFLLAGAAQLITISALLSADPLAPSWWALLLGIAPVLLAAAAVFAPRAVAKLAVVAAVVAMIVGIVGSLVSWHSGTSHIGVLFFPALAAATVGGLRFWRAGQR
jgi:uncharacterized oligopeptide transporter (OPT) family protein